VAIRPTKVRLHPLASTADAVDRLQGEVRRASYLGETMEYVVATPLGDVLVSSPDTQVPLEAGAAVALELPVGAVVLLQD
jgi:ABC-type Fe3+/spermidine/putrescine transport system ATPase subunit